MNFFVGLVSLAHPVARAADAVELPLLALSAGVGLVRTTFSNALKSWKGAILPPVLDEYLNSDDGDFCDADGFQLQAQCVAIFAEWCVLHVSCVCCVRVVLWWW